MFRSTQRTLSMTYMTLYRMRSLVSLLFFNDTATTEIYTLSLHDALPICLLDLGMQVGGLPRRLAGPLEGLSLDRKSTRLNSSHANISYAVFCLKKKQATLRSEEKQAHHKSRQHLERRLLL